MGYSVSSPFWEPFWPAGKSNPLLLHADQSPAEQSRTPVRFLKPDLVLIDDMGLKSLPPEAGEGLLEIILRPAFSQRHKSNRQLPSRSDQFRAWTIR